jgi:hypothetical protein
VEWWWLQRVVGAGQLQTAWQPLSPADTIPCLPALPATPPLLSPSPPQYGLGATLTLTCAQNLVGRVIGKGGETIKGLQRRFNVSVQIDQAQNPPVITISGPKQAATACQAEVRAIMADTGGPFGAPGGGPGFGEWRCGGLGRQQGVAVCCTYLGCILQGGGCLYQYSSSQIGHTPVHANWEGACSAATPEVDRADCWREHLHSSS